MRQVLSKGNDARKLGLATFCVALAALLLVPVLASTAFANTIEKQWTVKFTGTEIQDEGSEAIAQVIGGMQPGDEAKFTVELVESWDKAADWYMRNEVLETMEKSFDDANAESGGSYSYELVYISPKNEQKVILTNAVVSGDKGSGETNGLFDATESTGEWFYLDTLAPEAQAKVILTVGIDGETHGNRYFDTSAKLQLSFAAEPTDEPGTPGRAETPPQSDTTKPTVASSTDQPKKDEPKSTGERLSQTGDMLPLFGIAIVAIIAGVIVVVAVVRRRQSRKNEEGEIR